MAPAPRRRQCGLQLLRLFPLNRHPCEGRGL